MTEDLVQASDAALVVAIGRWRQDALAEAYRRHAGAVFSLARRVLADRSLAEEVVQEVFLRRRSCDSDQSSRLPRRARRRSSS